MSAAALLAVVLTLSPALQALAADNAAGTLPGAQGQELTPESAEAFLEAFFTSEAVAPQYVGAAVAIVQGDQIIAQRGFGYADRAGQIAVDPAETVFRIASVSKTFTAVAILQLVEQGRIDLNEDILAYLDGITYENPFDKPVTVKDLLTHQSGFEVRDPQPEDIHHDFSKVVPIEDYVRQHMPPVVREPGSSYMYDNFAYLLLGLIVQNVSGEPYDSYVQNHIFDPLGMESSGFRLEGELFDRLATLYDAAGEPMEPYAYTPTVMPHGGMLSTADDVAQFMIAMLNGGANETGRIFSESSVQAMTEYHSAAHPLLPNTTYGFEAAVQIPGAGSAASVIAKLGDLPGNSSGLYLLPEQKTGFFITYNQTGVLRDQFYQQFVATFFPEYAAPAALELAQPSSVEELARLNGVYKDLRLGSVISTVRAAADGVLTISDAYLGPRSLRQVDANLFTDDVTGQFTAFIVDETNQTVYMKEPYLNPLGYAQKAETPLGFSDIASDHPYAPYIHLLQSLGVYPNDADQAFDPDASVTRGELVRHLLEISAIAGSPSETYAFADIQDHPDAAYIQRAAELGIVQGTGEGRFAPDRPASRQEAAVMVWNAWRLLYPDTLFASVALTGETAEWAVPAVKMAVALGLHGPEVQHHEDGAADFRSTERLTRQEEAALLHQLLTQPVNLIVSQLAAQQSPPQEEAPQDAADAGNQSDEPEAAEEEAGQTTEEAVQE
jgi:CubicO group peptidase (beta-lactamase class C family)